MKTFLILTITFSFLLPTMLLAEEAGTTVRGPEAGTTVGGQGVITLKNPFGAGVNSLYGLLQRVINEILLPIGGVLAVLAFIYSGFLYVTAQGNEIKIKNAHRALLYTAVGTALLLGAWVFANVICGTIEAISGNPNICPNN